MNSMSIQTPIESIKIGDLISLQDEKVNVVLCRGRVCDLIVKDDYELCSVDHIHYFKTKFKENGRFNIVPRENEEGDIEGYITPFHHITDLVYADLEGTLDGNIFLNMSAENQHTVENSITTKLVDIYPKATVDISIGTNQMRITSQDDDESKDIHDLVRDIANVFGKYFTVVDDTIHADEQEKTQIFRRYLELDDYLTALQEANYRKLPEEELLYLNNIGRRSFQWELWSMCNNLCTYCYLGKENRHTDKVRQMTSLNDLHRSIDELDTRIYNNVSIIGGDFWQGQLIDEEVHDSFMLLMEKCAKLYANKKIGSLWITCTMTMGDQKDLYEALEIFKRYGVFPNENYGSSGVWLCTSWDIKGRFHTPDRLTNWEYHMKHIHELYPWVKFNCTIILMEDFLKAYLNGDWSPKKFMEEYHTSLFYKQIGLGSTADQEIAEEMGVPMPKSKIAMYRLSKEWQNKTYGFEFAPHRSTMLQFLRKYAIEDADTYSRLFNIRYRADELHRNYNDKEHDSMTKRNKNSANESDSANENMLNSCGHMLNYAPYVDSDKCCICDKIAVWQSIYGGGF